MKNLKRHNFYKKNYWKELENCSRDELIEEIKVWRKGYWKVYKRLKHLKNRLKGRGREQLEDFCKLPIKK